MQLKGPSSPMQVVSRVSDSIHPDSVHPFFAGLPEKVQRETLALIKVVNERHLHCEDSWAWPQAHYLITGLIYRDFTAKVNKRKPLAQIPVQVVVPQQITPDPLKVLPTRQYSSMVPLSQKEYNKQLIAVKSQMNATFHDPLFVDPVAEALQQHIMTPLSDNSELVRLLCHWVGLNVIFLPLGTHLLQAFMLDMAGESPFAKYVMVKAKVTLLPEARSQKVLAQMNAFLAEVAQAHSLSCVPTPPRSEQPTAVILSVKNGAGGHTAPAQAMAARLKERGWKVETIHYDTDLSAECDAYQLLGITFEDGTPMTETLYVTRWKMQKQNKEVSRIVGYYVGARKRLAPDLFVDDSGGDLLRHKILPLNPQLLITTLAYHWTWRSLAFRVTGAKTILVASDIFFHQEALCPWYRQQNIECDLRRMHFTTMTDDMELLSGMGVSHDQYFTKKHLGSAIDYLAPFYEGFSLDSQVSVIGAPIHPAFDAITNAKEIKRLRKKWGVPDGAISVCISRGKLGYDIDLIPALDSFRTIEHLPKPVVIHVVCGENTQFYNRLVAGDYKNLGPNITIIPHPLRAPKDFAELRAISILDDIKAGGGSTFEGWYLISKGIESMLLLTPGATLWWEIPNCDAMEKWGIGRTITETVSKIKILQEVILNGLPPITHRFPDWKNPFDKTVDGLL
jgi:hypothetical protein